MSPAEIIVWLAILGTIANAVYTPTQINKVREPLDTVTGWGVSVVYVVYACVLIYVLKQLP